MGKHTVLWKILVWNQLPLTYQYQLQYFLSAQWIRESKTQYVALPVAYRTGVTARSELSILYRTGYQGIVLLWCVPIEHISFRPYHGPGFDSARGENGYQEHFLGVKAAGAWGWPHHLYVPNVIEIWEPKPPGTLWATAGLLRESFTFFF